LRFDMSLRARRQTGVAICGIASSLSLLAMTKRECHCEPQAWQSELGAKRASSLLAVIVRRFAWGELAAQCLLGGLLL